MGGKISISQMYITEYENIRKDSQLYENIQKNILSGEVYFIIPDNYEWLNYDIGINTIRLLLMDNVNDNKISHIIPKKPGVYHVYPEISNGEYNQAEA